MPELRDIKRKLAYETARGELDETMRRALNSTGWERHAEMSLLCGKEMWFKPYGLVSDPLPLSEAYIKQRQREALARQYMDEQREKRALRNGNDIRHRS